MCVYFLYPRQLFSTASSVVPFTHVPAETSAFVAVDWLRLEVGNFYLPDSWDRGAGGGVCAGQTEEELRTMAEASFLNHPEGVPWAAGRGPYVAFMPSPFPLSLG